MPSYQSQYYTITNDIIYNPTKIGKSRVGNINSRFSEQIRIDLTKEFPLMDIKKIKFSNVLHELLWMIRGDTNIKYLVDNNCHIWDDDAYRYYIEKYAKWERFKDPSLHLSEEPLSKEDFIQAVKEHKKLNIYSANPSTYYYGDLDRIYGYNFRKFNGKTDQLLNSIIKLKSNPDDRRMLINLHNPTDIEDNKVGLPACHNYINFYTIPTDTKRKLNCFVNIRSNDFALGNPYNVVQYTLLVHIIAKLTDMIPNELVINAVDCHIYHEHFEGMKEWIKRYSKTYPVITKERDNIYNVNYNNAYCKAKLKINGEQQNLEDFKAEDFEIIDYNPQPYIKMKLLT